MLRAIYTSILRSIEAGFTNLIVEMDSNIMYEFLKQGRRCMTIEGGLIFDLTRVTSRLDSCEWVVCSKSSNKVAYTLASLAINTRGIDLVRGTSSFTIFCYLIVYYQIYSLRH